MAEFLTGMKRTKMCGLFSREDEGLEVVSMGFVSKYRNLGSIIFVDLRDRTGIVQLAFSNDIDKGSFEKAQTVRNEYVLAIKGKVSKRAENNVNLRMTTGEIEILVSELRIISEAETPPFNITEESNVNEAMRLKYRYLDLRRASLQRLIILRDKITLATHNYMSSKGFLNIETPFLGKSTPEGARDYLVPSRVNLDTFYALPQSPQIYKQLLMISGFDRYYQIARCFRDEDLRANRQPEFTQIDIEMSYVDDISDVMDIAEGLIRNIFKESIGLDLPPRFRRIEYKEAMERFGSDKPDTRFSLELINISEILVNTGFGAFEDSQKEGYSIRAININGAADYTRKEIDKLSIVAREYGAKGVFSVAFKKDGVSSSLLKYIDEEKLVRIKNKLKVNEGDLIIIIADKNKIVFDSLGAIRLYLGKTLGLIDEKNYDILWVTHFPLYEYDEKENRLAAMHHPFTSPLNEDLIYLESDPLRVRAKAYDLVINGQEAGGGSIRIHSKEIQKKMFEIIGLSKEDILHKFGFFVDAFRYGVPPHGGLAFGLDRLVMLLGKTENIKDVIAFPKNQSAQCLMSDAPSTVDIKQLKEIFPNGKVFNE
ncbi:MAG: Aspartate--tRNA ligase [Firmicutes bacterium ADurb.Bin080]|jgi:aspartyl-tRNA synthetase|nr:aspartate--tRNA ligase [Clostridiales bacterium]OQC12696.1 MAG: Aspartate--tRNA ligase [Firmicutes bacterium ADurb.Bin080]